MVKLNNLSPQVSDDHLREICGIYGKVERLDRLMWNHSGVRKATAILRMDTPQHAQDLIDYLNGVRPFLSCTTLSSVSLRPLSLLPLIVPFLFLLFTVSA